MVDVGVFGLGEAGAAIAIDLAEAGARVIGYDPADVATPKGIDRARNPTDAVVDADVVLAITASSDAQAAFEQAAAALPERAIYADLSTSSASAKQRLALLCAGRGAAFVDVALMSTVPGKGMRTPSLASGTGADAYVRLLSPLGVTVESVGDVAGVAATRKLLRSVVLKGVAGLVIESMRAANAAGLAEETWANLVDQFTVMDETFLRRLVSGTEPHAVRRLHEMEATAELLAELDVEPIMTAGTIENLRRVPDQGLPDLPS